MPPGLELCFHARRHFRRVHPAVREDAVRRVAVVESGGENDDAKRLLDARHPRTGLRQRRDARPGERPRDGHADTEHEGQRQRRGGACRVEVTREQHHLDHHWCDARAGKQRRDPAHREGEHHRPLASANLKIAGVAREVDVDHVKHRQAQEDEQQRDASVEPGRGVDGAERTGREHDNEAEDAVHRGHRRTVREPEQEAALARAGLRAGADDGEVDRNHRQHARREVQREAADEHEQQDRDGPAPLEHPLLADAVLGVMDEGEKVAARQVPEGRALFGEAVERRDLGVGRRAGLKTCPYVRIGPEARTRPCVLTASSCGGTAIRSRPCTRAEGDAAEHVLVRRHRSRTADRERPSRFRARGDVAHRFVARLVAQPCWHSDLSRPDAGVYLEDDADGELALEHAEWLIGAALLQVGGLRKDDLSDRDAGGQRLIGGRHRQHDRDQHRVAWRVRVHVVAVRQLHTESDVNLGTWSDRVGFDERRQFSLGRTALRGQEGGRTKEEGERRENGSCAHGYRQSLVPSRKSAVSTNDLRPATCDYFTSWRRITPGSGGNDETSTEPFSGGRS